MVYDSSVVSADDSRMSTGEEMIGQVNKQKSDANQIRSDNGSGSDGSDDNDIWDNDNEDELELEEDIYSMMFLTSRRSISFFYAFSTALMQLFIISLFLFDLIKNNNPSNYLNLPTTVNVRIRMAQFIALPLCVMTHEDCTTAIYYLRAKYHSSILKKVPSATESKWKLCKTCIFDWFLLLE